MVYECREIVYCLFVTLTQCPTTTSGKLVPYNNNFVPVAIASRRQGSSNLACRLERVFRGFSISALLVARKTLRSIR